MKKIVVTGAAGFIGSNLARFLNQKGLDSLILADKFDNPLKQKNIEGIRYEKKIDRDEFIAWLRENSHQVDFIFHLGARTDTTEFNFEVFDALNLTYSKMIWEICAECQIPLVYASSAATYGLGENGFSDDHALIKSLKPLNPYGVSKHLFDVFALEEKKSPPFWAGLKFFNVYGPYEFHKGRMASVVLHAYKQIRETGGVKLFKSHKPEYKDGEQLRDFIFIDDVIEVCNFFLEQNEILQTSNKIGIYNVGTGKARTFNSLVNAIFASLRFPIHIEYIPIPEDIRDKYQYFTEARMEKLIAAGYSKSFTPIERGVKKYLDFIQSTVPSL